MSCFNVSDLTETLLYSYYYLRWNPDVTKITSVLTNLFTFHIFVVTLQTDSLKLFEYYKIGYSDHDNLSKIQTDTADFKQLKIM